MKKIQPRVGHDSKEETETISEEHQTSLETAADPFYNPENIAYLEKKWKAYKEGKLNLMEGALIDGSDEPAAESWPRQNQKHVSNRKRVF